MKIRKDETIYDYAERKRTLEAYKDLTKEDIYERNIYKQKKLSKFCMWFSIMVGMGSYILGLYIGWR